MTIWSEDHGNVSLLTSAGESIKLPLSTAGDTKSCILLDGSQFVSSEGRWTVEFDNDYSISNSMKPPPLPTTSPVKDGSSTTDGPSPSPDDKVEEVVQPFHGNDSGFFEDVVQEEKAIPTNRSMHTGHTIFGNEHKDGDGLHDKIVKAFEEHQATSKHDQEKINENQEAQGISPETDITSASDELEQDQATDPLTESSSQIHDGNAEQLAAYGNTASSDDPDSEETEEEDADAVSDHEESSSPVKAVPYYRPAGEESQPIPEAGAVDAADAFKRSAGQESQAISSNMFLEHSDQILGQASQAIPQRAACGLYQRAAGQESQLIPTESLSNRYRRQTAPESQDVLHVDPTKTDGPTSTETRQTSSPEKAPNPLKRDLGEESQVLEQHVASGLADVVTQVASSAPEIPGTSSTFVATQRSTTSEFHTPRMSRVSKPLARTGTFQSPRAPKLSKRKQSESVDMEASRPEHKRLRTPLVTKFRRHSNASSETSTTSSYHDATAAPPATSHDEADADTITVNTSGSTKRSQSTQSTRSSKRRRTQTSVIPGSIGFPSNPKVVFSGRCATKSKKIAMDAFGRLGGLVVDKALEADLVCIPGDELKKSPKIILALIHGKHIVTERWITECNRQKLFPDPAKYLPIDLEREQDWQFNLKAAIGRGRAEDGKLRKLIMGYKV
ncbi:hypothetical protein PMZ80_003385 [Knufia obscura]|uniref:BRCT domain-containing protein n=1 Tax=Knufia obscura TaxID=1635080 RepID=A0ABR0RV71_9EURO|nr:hypothetical protein PMZ80_003385 [Knufia obscura]